MKQHFPITLRLALVAGVATTVFLALVGSGLYLRTKASLDGGIDASLRARAADLEQSVDQATTYPRLSGGSTTFEQLIASDGAVLAGSTGPPLLTTGELRTARAGATFRWRREQARLLAIPVSRDRVLVVGTSITSRERALESLAAALIVGIPVAGLLAGLAALLVARRALVPVQRLRRRAAELALDDDPGGLVIPDTHDEIEDLARTFDEMLKGLSKARRHEREFVANASHQLRTPIAIIEAELELALSDSRADVSELRRALASAHGEARRLASLARRLLDLSLADEGALPLEHEEIDIGLIAADAAQRFAPRAARERRAVRFEGGSAVASCDRERISEVLDALIDNALVHGERSVLLEVAANDAWVRISVADEGRGFPEGAAEKVLERFVTFAGGSSHTGLGLSLADAVVRAHGGRIEIDGREGRTAVHVLLPESSGALAARSRGAAR